MQRAVNPYFCYAFSFTVALLTYLLGWSDLYPPLSLLLFVFIASTIGIHIFFGIRIERKKIFSFKPIALRNSRSPGIITAFIYLLWILEFLHEGGIPLLKIVMKQPYDYRLFGIPSLHVFVVTFSSFYTIFLFHLYLSSRKKSILFLYAINLIAALLIYSRAMFFFNVTASFFIFLYTINRVSTRLIYLLPTGLVVLFYIFGILGTLRVSNESEKKKYDNSLFLEIGKANNRFTDSVIPHEFFWAYIYMSSPLANLQTNINTYPQKPRSVQRTAELINNEILLDFISKRINSLFHLERETENTIPERPFNVSTVYSRSYSYLGWWGMILMACVIVVIPVFYLKMIAVNSPFFLTGAVILSTMFLFMAYDNTIRFTGLSFQLVYPILLNLVSSRFPRLWDIFA